MGVGFIGRASALGFDVPHDLSGTGFDGINLGGYVRPALTTVVTSPLELGQQAAKTLLRLVDRQSAGDHDIAPTRLLERHSLVRTSRRPPAHAPKRSGPEWLAFESSWC